MTAHAYLPPSGASTWSKCTMWATMNQRYPQTESSPESEEGTAAHWVATEMHAGRKWPVGTQTPNSLIVTEEMIEFAEMICEVITARMGGLTVHVEQTCSIRLGEGPSGVTTFGTPDFWATTGHTKRIEVIDGKYGHRFVDEYFNPQLLCYLAGILELAFGQLDKLDPQTEVNFTIVQPRCFYKGSPVRTHSFKLIECQPYMRALADAAASSLMPNPVATTNEGCCYCPGRHSCSALQLATYSDSEFATDRLPLDLTPQQAALELRLLERAYDRLGCRVDGLREQTLSAIRSGANVPWYRVEQGKGRTQWNVPTEQVLSLGELFGVNLSKVGTISPTQARKLGVDESVISAYSQTPATGFKLVADNPADARRLFGT
jgi:hypothetical protein